MESSKRTQKRDRAQQKSTFRDLLHSIKTFPAVDYFSAYPLTFQHDAASIDSWSMYKRLQILRLLYAEGLQVQIMAGNNVVRGMLEMEEVDIEEYVQQREDAMNISKDDRRYLQDQRDEARKVRDAAIQKRRGNKRADQSRWHD
jgi:hypothetical protein